jgi:hypothetical protein
MAGSSPILQIEGLTKKCRAFVALVEIDGIGRPP